MGYLGKEYVNAVTSIEEASTILAQSEQVLSSLLQLLLTFAGKSASIYQLVGDEITPIASSVPRITKTLKLEKAQVRKLRSATASEFAEMFQLGSELFYFAPIVTKAGFVGVIVCEPFPGIRSFSARDKADIDLVAGLAGQILSSESCLRNLASIISNIIKE